MCAFTAFDQVLAAARQAHERYHAPLDLDIGQGRWRIDLSVWLRDLHGHVADWHTELRDTITDEQGWRCCGSRTSGIGSRATPMR
jgi:hypothetical protein